MTESRVVLICLDKNSENSKAILKEFAENHHKPDDVLILMTVFDYSCVETPVIFSTEDVTVSAECWKTSVKEVHETILRNLNESRIFLTKYSIPTNKIDTFFKESTSGIAETICASANELGCNFVVVGKHVRGVVDRVLIGSNSTYIAHHNSKPTVLITIPG